VPGGGHRDDLSARHPAPITHIFNGPRALFQSAPEPDHQRGRNPHQHGYPRDNKPARKRAKPNADWLVELMNDRTEAEKTVAARKAVAVPERVKALAPSSPR
jgi:hypothetical protein